MFIRATALLAVVLASLAVSGDARAFFVTPVPTTVVEYKNVNLNHYFMTANSLEMAAIESGAAGEGWYRTGFGFDAYVAEGPSCDGCKPVSRFYGTPGLGPNSHFFTASVDEANGLKQPGSGWSFENIAFSINVPDASGNCAPGLVPVYRVYNNRWMFNDSNHRYLTDQGERAKMIAAGWADEGARFCSRQAQEITLKSYPIQILDREIMVSAQCEDETQHLGSCIAVNNVPVPNQLVGPFTQAESYRLYGLTGQFWDHAYAPGPSSVDALAHSTFVQAGGQYNGIHIDTQSRDFSPYTSVNPLYQFKTTVGADGSDPRFFPWRAAPFETEIAMKGSVNVVTIATRGAGSVAYGHPTLEFIDLVSGHHVYFTMLAYTTMPGQDFVAADVGTGKVIVSSTMRANTFYGRNLGGTTLLVPSGFQGNTNAYWMPIDFRLNRSEFQVILDAARGVDPALSANPDTYIVDNFHFTNEIYGDGEIGVGEYLSLQVLRRR